MRVTPAVLLLLLLAPAERAPAANDGVPVPVDYTANPVVHADEVDAGPRRIVSTAPNLTELCAALGLADRVVGRTQYCTHPPGVARAAVIGAYVDTNFEKILSLQPDVVLVTQRSHKLIAQLDALQLKYESLPDNSLPEIYQAITKLGAICKRPKTAATLVQNLQADLQALQRRAGTHKQVSVLFTLNPLPARPSPLYAAGPGSHLDDLLALAGYTNAVHGLTDDPWPKISVEHIIAAKPDFILEPRPAEDQVEPERLYRSWSPLERIPAIGHRRIRSIRSSAAVKPGPRVNLVLHEIIQVLSE